MKRKADDTSSEQRSRKQTEKIESGSLENKSAIMEARAIEQRISEAAGDPCRVLTQLQLLASLQVDAHVLKSTGLARQVGKLRRHPDTKCKEAAQKQVDAWKEILKRASKIEQDGQRTTETLTVAIYRKRLVSGMKELYKDPPVLPVRHVTVEAERKPLPIRDSSNRLVFKDMPSFRPNLTPAEVLELGSFGGTYFRSIDSAVVGRRITSTEALDSTVPSDWVKGLNRNRMLTSSGYDKSVNQYKVKCGGSLGMWESSGWISELDPYGWFQWYCRFYQGRRTSDDARQISRAQQVMGPTGRFRTQLMNKVIKAKTTFNDRGISPVIRQSLQHWGYRLTSDDLAAHRKKKGI